MDAPTRAWLNSGFDDARAALGLPGPDLRQYVSVAKCAEVMGISTQEVLRLVELGVIHANRVWNEFEPTIEVEPVILASHQKVSVGVSAASTPADGPSRVVGPGRVESLERPSSAPSVPYQTRREDGGVRPSYSLLGRPSSRSRIPRMSGIRRVSSGYGEGRPEDGRLPCD
jgi:hypothetical protein